VVVAADTTIFILGGPGQSERAILTSSSGNLFFKIDFGLLEKCVEN
jgi:hypothetical protein